MANLKFSKKYRIIFILGYLVLVVIWGAGFNTRLFFSKKDNMDYAQMGREIVRGHGFSTLQVFPGHLPYLQKEKFLERDHIPNLYRFPLPTVSNALFQLVVPDPVTAGVIQSGVWMLLGIPFLFLTIRRFSGDFAAILGSIFYFFDNLIHSYSGLGETLTTFLMVLLLYYIMKQPKRNLFIQGLLVGLMVLSRTLFLFLLPVLFVFYLSEKESLKQIMLALTGFLLLFGPWMLRNLNLTGSPIFSFTNSRNIVYPFTDTRPDPFYTLDLKTDTFQAALTHRDLLVQKVGRNAARFFSPEFWWGRLSVFSVFLALSLILYFFPGDPFVKKRAALMFLVFLLTFFLYTPFLLIPRWFVPLKPVILVFFMVFFFRILGELKKKWSFHPLLLHSLISLFLAVIILIWVVQPGKIKALLVKQPPDQGVHLFERLKRIVRGKNVLSDISHKIALLCDTRVVRAPIDPGLIETIDREYLKIDYIVLSRELSVKIRKNYKEAFWKQPLLNRYTPLKQFGGMHVYQRKE